MHFRDRRKDIVITCPNCGREYLPAEIFVPSAFFGRPMDIERLTGGEIEVFDGTTMDTSEEFTCEYCGEPFVVTTDIRFKTVKKSDLAMKEEYVSKVYPSRIALFEDGAEAVGNDSN